MDMEDQWLIDVKWNCANNDHIKECVIYRTEAENAEDEPDTELPTKSVVLHRPISDSGNLQELIPENCHIKFSTNSHIRYEAVAVDIICSARRVEVFGKHEEYEDTSEGLWLELDEDLSHGNHSYLLQHTFKQPTDAFMLSFVSLQNGDQLWIHSIHVTHEAVTVPPIQQFLPGMGPTIDMSKVKAIMEEMGQETPEHAKKLLSAMEYSQKSREASLGALGPILSGIFGTSDRPQTKETLGHTGTERKEMSDLMKNFDTHSLNQNQYKSTKKDIQQPTLKTSSDTSTGPPKFADFMSALSNIERQNNGNLQSVKTKRTEDVHSSTESRGKMTSSQHNSDVANLLPLMSLIETKFNQIIQSMEQRLLYQFQKEMHKSEERIITKVNDLLERQKTGEGSTRNDISKTMEIVDCGKIALD